MEDVGRDIQKAQGGDIGADAFTDTLSLGRSWRIIHVSGLVLEFRVQALTV